MKGFTVEIGGIDRKPDMYAVPKGETVTVRRKSAGVGFIEVEIGPTGKVRIRTWAKMTISPEASNVIDIEEENST